MATQIPIFLTPQNLPANTCYPNEQARLVDFVAHTVGTLPINFTATIVSPTAPGPDDRDKVWVQVDGNNQILGINTFANGAWNVMFPAAPYICPGEFREYDPSLFTPPQTALQPWFPCDGSVTGVPDRRGTFAVCAGQRTLPSGSTDTATNFIQGVTGGFERLFLTIRQIPAHLHNALVSGGFLCIGGGSGGGQGNNGWIAEPTTDYTGGASNPNPTTGAPGTSDPVGTLPPYFPVHYMQWRPDLA